MVRDIGWHQLGLAVGQVLLSAVTCVASAQDKPKIEVVANVPTSWVKAVAISPDGKHVMSGSMDRTLRLWEADSGRLIRGFDGHLGNVTSVAFSPDGSQVLSGSHDKTLRLWEARTGQLLRTFEGHSDLVTSVAFSPDGTRLLSGSFDLSVKVWNTVSGQVIRSFDAHKTPVTCVAFSPDGTQVVSGSDDTLKLWDAATGQILHTFEGPYWQVRSVAFSADGRRLVSASTFSVKLWDVATGQLLRRFDELISDTDSISSVAISPDGTQLLVGSRQSLNLLNAGNGQLLHTFKGLYWDVTSVAFSPDRRRVLSGSQEGVKLWDVGTGQLLRTFGAERHSIYSVALSPDGTRLLTGWDKTVKLWDATTGRLLRTFKGHSDFLTSVNSVAFSPDGTRLVSCGRGEVKLWDVTTGQVLLTFNEDLSDMMAVLFSPDGTRVVGAGHGRTKLWDAVTGHLLRTFEEGSVSSLAFSYDGTRLFSGGRGSINMWDADAGQLLHTFKNHEQEVVGPSVFSVASSPDGTRLLSSSADRTARLWDVESGRLLNTLKSTLESGYSRFSVTFARDGTPLLSSDEDRTVKLWDAATGRLLRTFDGRFAEGVYTLSRDINRLVAGRESEIRIWNVASGEELARLFALPGEDWLSVTPAGYFAHSSKGTELLSVVRGLDVSTMSQIHQSLFNPDLVREALAGDPGGEVQEAAKVINLETVIDSGPAPDVLITSHRESAQSSGELVKIAARIIDRGKGIGRIEWRVNGVTAAVTTKATGSGRDYVLTQRLALDPGQNVIEVVAYNASNLLASLPARTTITFTGSADQAKPNLYILAIGINVYKDRGWKDTAFGPLTLAVKDAETFAAEMKTAAAGQYGKVKVITALDQQATKDSLSKLVDRIAREIHRRDTFILFAAAHGFSVDGRYYLIPQDYDGGTNPVTLAKSAIDQGMLQDWLANRIKAKKAVVFLDTCESGALIAGYSRLRTDSTSEAAIGRLHEATGRPVLTASALGQYAYEDSLGQLNVKHGLFTWALLQALRNGDSNGNNLIELSELVAYVQDQVPKLAAQLGGAGSTKSAMGGAIATSDVKQQARFGSRGEDFVLVRRLQ